MGNCFDLPAPISHRALERKELPALARWLAPARRQRPCTRRARASVPLVGCTYVVYVCSLLGQWRLAHSQNCTMTQLAIYRCILARSRSISPSLSHDSRPLSRDARAVVVTRVSISCVLSERSVDCSARYRGVSRTTWLQVRKVWRCNVYTLRRRKYYSCTAKIVRISDLC